MKRGNLFTLLLILTILTGAFPVTAQEEPDAFVNYVLNVRGGPGVTFAMVEQLQPGTGMVFEARNEDMSWLLGHTVDGSIRGWVASLYFSYVPGFTAARLPLSAETTAGPPAPANAPASEDVAPPAVSQDVSAFIPTVSPRVREIFLHGQTRGNNPRVFTKAGDCNSNSHRYLSHLFGTGQYDLGAYGHLQTTIEHFAPSFMPINVASSPGFNIHSVLDSTYADPKLCGGRSPVACDFERLHPSIIFINQNMGDVMALDANTYREALRSSINLALEHGVIPVLVTFPLYAKAQEFNQIMRNLATEYAVPLVDFSAAAAALPNQGMEGDGGDGIRIHLTGRDFINFNGEQHVYGFTMLNLLTLQTLESLRAVMY